MVNNQPKTSDFKPKSTKSAKLWLPPDVKYRQRWVCLWEDENGAYIVNESGEYMCAESWDKGNPDIEAKMFAAAKAFGIEGGRPVWIPGRKITDMEADDQMERLLMGKIPDEKEEILAAVEEEWLKKHGNPERD